MLFPKKLKLSSAHFFCMLLYFSIISHDVFNVHTISVHMIVGLYGCRYSYKMLNVHAAISSIYN